MLTIDRNLLELLIDPKTKEAIILKVLQDQVLWYRVSNAIWHAANACSRETQDFEPENHYSGYNVLLTLIGVKDNEYLCGQLSDIVWDNIMNDDKSEFTMLASKIYAEWMECLKNYSLNLKPVA